MLKSPVWAFSHFYQELKNLKVTESRPQPLPNLSQRQQQHDDDERSTSQHLPSRRAEGCEEVGSATGVYVCVHAKSLQFCPSLWNTTDRSPPGKNTGVGCRALLQGIFPSQGSNLHLLCLLDWQEGSLPSVPPESPWRMIINIEYHPPSAS